MYVLVQDIEWKIAATCITHALCCGIYSGCGVEVLGWFHLQAQRQNINIFAVRRSHGQRADDATAAHFAARRVPVSVEVLQWLHDHGVDMQARLKNGQRPVDLVQSKHGSELEAAAAVALLKEFEIGVETL
jgi:hypothetical protein